MMESCRRHAHRCQDSAEPNTCLRDLDHPTAATWSSITRSTRRAAGLWPGYRRGGGRIEMDKAVDPVKDEAVRLLAVILEKHPHMPGTWRIAPDPRDDQQRNKRTEWVLSERPGAGRVSDDLA